MKIINTKVTEKEWELLDTVRNYKRSFPNGFPELRWYTEQVFMELLDEPLDDTTIRELRAK